MESFLVKMSSHAPELVTKALAGDPSAILALSAMGLGFIYMSLKKK